VSDLALQGITVRRGGRVVLDAADAHFASRIFLP
jgi:hypothetical protein